MTRIPILASLLGLALLWPLAVQALPVEEHNEGCKSERDMTRFLANKHGERKVWFSQHSTGARVELWQAYEGTTWTILTVIAGESCIRVQGKTGAWLTPRWP